MNQQLQGFGMCPQGFGKERYMNFHGMMVSTSSCNYSHGHLGVLVGTLQDFHVLPVAQNNGETWMFFVAKISCVAWNAIKTDPSWRFLVTESQLVPKRGCQLVPSLMDYFSHPWKVLVRKLSFWGTVKKHVLQDRIAFNMDVSKNSGFSPKPSILK